MSVHNGDKYATGSVNPYELSPEQRHHLVESLLNERPPEGDDRIVCYRLAGDDPFADIARSIECEVFDKEFKNTPSDMQEEYGPYEAASAFFLSVDRDDVRAVGALRVISNSTDTAEGFKTLDDIPEAYARDFAKEYGVEKFSKVWDIGTVVVLPEYRSQEGAVSGQLYAGMHATAMAQSIEHYVSAINTKVYKKMYEFLGIPFEPLYGMPETYYLGVWSQFVHGDVAAFLPSVQAKRQEFFAVDPIREATAPLVGEANSALQFADKIPK